MRCFACILASDVPCERETHVCPPALLLLLPVCEVQALLLCHKLGGGLGDGFGRCVWESVGKKLFGMSNNEELVETNDSQWQTVASGFLTGDV